VTIVLENAVVTQFEPAAVLVLRIWREGADGSLLYARLTQTSDVTGPGMTAALAGTADDVCAAVKDWIDEFVVRTSSNSHLSK